MKILKGILKFVLLIITIVLTLLLSVDIILYNIRDVSSQFISEEKLRESLKNFSIFDLLKDENGNTIAEISRIENILVESGVPIDVVDSFIDSTPVQELANDITIQAVDYILYGEKIDTPMTNQDQLFSFFEDNMARIVEELQEQNVPNSELLTEERQAEIIQRLESKMPIIEQEINNMTSILEEQIASSSEYQKVQEYQAKLNEAITLIRFIYGEKIMIAFTIIFIICIVGIILSRLSVYRFFKWFGFSSFIVGIILYMISFNASKLFDYLNQIPYAFQNLLMFFLEDFEALFFNRSIFYFIIGMVFIILNIIFWFFLQKKGTRR